MVLPSHHYNNGLGVADVPLDRLLPANTLWQRVVGLADGQPVVILDLAQNPRLMSKISVDRQGTNTLGTYYGEGLLGRPEVLAHPIELREVTEIHLFSGPPQGPIIAIQVEGQEQSVPLAGIEQIPPMGAKGKRLGWRLIDVIEQVSPRFSHIVITGKNGQELSISRTQWRIPVDLVWFKRNPSGQYNLRWWHREGQEIQLVGKIRDIQSIVLTSQ